MVLRDAGLTRWRGLEWGGHIVRLGDVRVVWILFMSRLPLTAKCLSPCRVVSWSSSTPVVILSGMRKVIATVKSGKAKATKLTCRLRKTANVDHAMSFQGVFHHLRVTCSGDGGLEDAVKFLSRSPCRHQQRTSSYCVRTCNNRIFGYWPSPGGAIMSVPAS